MTIGADIGWAADPHLPKGEWLATTRFGLRPAAGGLALVQDFLNTGAEQARDLLADATHAEDWSTRAARSWSLERDIEAQPPVLADGDAVKLRDLRALIDALVSGESPNGAGGGDLGAAAFTLSKEGELRWQPTGRGWAMVVSCHLLRGVVKPALGDLAAVEEVPQSLVRCGVLRPLVEQQRGIAWGTCAADTLAPRTTGLGGCR